MGISQQNQKLEIADFKEQIKATETYQTLLSMTLNTGNIDEEKITGSAVIISSEVSGIKNVFLYQKKLEDALKDRFKEDMKGANKPQESTESYVQTRHAT